MITVKINCACGQRYAFDIEPVDGRIPSPVACPVCGADGTAAAEENMAQSQVPAAVIASGEETVRAKPLALVAQPAMPKPSQSSRTGALQADRSRDEAEVRSKIFWGDPPDEVVKFAMTRGFLHDEAQELVASFVQERVTMLRGIGFQKIATGVGLMCVPIVAYVIFHHIGVLPIKLFAMAVAVGLYGAYRVLKGSFMVFLPKSEPGDIADK